MLKNLANCKPSEFLVQTNRLRKAAAKWMDATKIMEIRAKMPTLKPVEGSEEEKAAIQAENRKAVQAQAMKNAMDILDAALETNAAGTLEVLALSCFVEPEHVDDHEIGEFLAAWGDMLSNENVLRFFTSLVQLGQMFGSTAANQ